MKYLSVRKLFVFFFLFSLALGTGNAQIFHRNPEKKLFGKTSGIHKETKVREPRSVLRGKRKQEANDRRLKRNYDKAVKKSQQRTYDIQTPEVKARMKQNKKDYSSRDKGKKKKVRSSTKSAGKKYK
jgi:hypothetical protein